MDPNELNELDVLTVPDRFTYITALRNWDVAEPFGHFLSPSFVWVPGQPSVANCRYHEHPAPDFNCTCGLYAIKNITQHNKFYTSEGNSFGEIALWGTVITHEDGYRAQYAYPLSVFCPNKPHLAEMASKLYNIPVLSKDEAEALVKKYQPPPPVETCRACGKTGHGIFSCPTVDKVKLLKLAASAQNNATYRQIYPKAKALGMTVAEYKKRYGIK